MTIITIINDTKKNINIMTLTIKVKNVKENLVCNHINVLLYFLFHFLFRNILTALFYSAMPYFSLMLGGGPSTSVRKPSCLKNLQ